MLENSEGGSREIERLFRSEVYDSKRDRLQGDVFLAQPIRRELGVVICFALIVAVGVCVAEGRYSRTEEVTGVVATDGSSAGIIAIEPGVVTKMFAKEGLRVKAGEVLAFIKTDQDFSPTGRATQISIEAVDQQRTLILKQINASNSKSNADVDSIKAAIASDKRQLENMSEQIDLQKQLIASMEGAINRYLPIVDRGFVSINELERRRQDVLIAKQSLARLIQQREAVSNDVLKYRSQLKEINVEKILQIMNGKSAVENLRIQKVGFQRSQGYVVRSPIAGTVTAIQSGRGRHVDSSMTLMTVIPANAGLHINLFVPSRAVGFVRTRQSVRILYDAFPYERYGSFGGHIAAIAATALSPKHIEAPFTFQEPMYLTKVAVDSQSPGAGNNLRLQPGMTLKANIVIERQSFFEWLLSPIRAGIRAQ